MSSTWFPITHLFWIFGIVEDLINCNIIKDQTSQNINQKTEDHGDFKVGIFTFVKDSDMDSESMQILHDHLLSFIN